MKLNIDLSDSRVKGALFAAAVLTLPALIVTGAIWVAMLLGPTSILYLLAVLAATASGAWLAAGEDFSDEDDIGFWMTLLPLLAGVMSTSATVILVFGGA